jgi:hypothetical protein
LLDVTKLEFSRQIFGKLQISDLMKICPVGAKLFHTDGRTDKRDEADSRFLNFSNVLKNLPVNAVFGNNRFCSQIHTKHTNTLCGQKVEL